MLTFIALSAAHQQTGHLRAEEFATAYFAGGRSATGGVIGGTGVGHRQRGVYPRITAS
jgi:hypothetical protein